MILNNILNPVYPLAVIACVALLATVASYLFPFYRRELAVEDQTRLTPLDGLRGLLCFAVLCHHAMVTFRFLGTGQWLVPPTNFYWLLGHTPVALFFCVTAFLFWSMVVAQSGELTCRTFFRARCFRIVPLYVLSGLLALAAAWPQMRPVSGEGSSAGGLGTLLSLGCRQWGTVGGVDLSLVNARVTWSLRHEWVFYLLLPALALIVRDPRHAPRLWLLPVALAIWLGPDPSFFFVPGMLAVYACRSPRLVAFLRSRQAAGLVVLATAAFPWLTGDSFSYPALLMTTVIFLPIAAGNTLCGVLNWRGLRLMGLVSYSVYLLHGIALYAARPFLAEVMHAPAHRVWWWWGAVAASAAAVLLGSLCTYRWVEWPFMQMERRWRHSARTPRAGVPPDLEPASVVAEACVSVIKIAPAT